MENRRMDYLIVFLVVLCIISTSLIWIRAGNIDTAKKVAVMETKVAQIEASQTQVVQWINANFPPKPQAPATPEVKK